MSDIRKSIGIFYKPENGHNDGMAIEVHVNLWSIKGKKKPFYALDFGLMMPKRMKDVLILLPFTATIDENSDIGGKLANDKELLCSVFHENYQTEEVVGNSNIHKIKEDGNLLFYIYKLTLNTSLTLEKNEAKNDYTEIYIKHQCQEDNINGAEKLYVRFQIKLEDLKPFAKDTQISNDFFQSAFSSSHLFDFRINDLREIDSGVKENIEHNGYVSLKLTKVHFFYMSEISETVDYANNLYVDTRMLEQNLWNNYLGNNEILKGEHLAYHWKQLDKNEKITIETHENGNQNVVKSYENKPDDSFSLFFKTTYMNFNKWRLMSYSFFVVLLGAISSVVISLVALIGNCPLITGLVLGGFLVVLLVIVAIIIRNLK